MDADSSFDAGRFADWLAERTVEELPLIVEMAATTLRDAAATAGDLDAVCERAFIDGFDSSGTASAPWVSGDLIICCGSRIDSGSGHRCRFVTVNNDWVWESSEKLIDKMRPGVGGLRTVTVIAAVPGTSLDVITSTARGGQHRRKSSERYQVEAAASGVALVLTGRLGAGTGRNHR